MIGYVELDAEDVMVACNSFLEYYDSKGVLYQYEHKDNIGVVKKLFKLAETSGRLGNGSVILDQEAVNFLF